MADDHEAYAASIAPRKNVLDRKRIGNIHQQVGQHVLLELRQSVDERWVEQSSCCTAGAAEWPLPPRAGRDHGTRSTTGATSRIAQCSTSGCGPGLFVRLFASRGARVVGVDTILTT